MLVENTKEFLKLKGLNWTGNIVSHSGKTTRQAKEEDFKNLTVTDYLIDFGEEGEVSLALEVDEITFKCYGETFDIGYEKYAGNNKEIKKLIKSLNNKDFSEEFIKFQLKKSGLIYAATLRLKCLEKKNKINEDSLRREKQYRRKIDYLYRNIEKEENSRIKQCEEIDNILKLADKY